MTTTIQGEFEWIVHTMEEDGYMVARINDKIMQARNNYSKVPTRH